MPADTIFHNGVVHTVDANNTIAEAVAVEAGRISAVGSNTAVRAEGGPNTKHVDLAGRSLTPGFIDAHHHFTGVGGAQDAIDCKAPGMQSISAIVEAVRQRAATLPPGTWIRGRGYDQSRLAEQRHPNRHDFDPVSPDHPVVFTRTCGHIIAFNSKALELSGLPANAPDPDGGRYDRDSDGSLNGVSYERANGPIHAAATPSPAEQREWLKAANAADLKSGLTSIHDAGGMMGVPINIAKDLVDRDELQVRIYAFCTVNSFEHPHVPILNTGLRTGFGDERLRIGAFKVMTDGSSSGPTAATREPYTIDSDDFGIAYWAQDDLDNLIGRAHRAGWQCTVHAVGDKAVEMTLNAMARAQSEFPREGLRHRIDHCGITPPDLQERVKRQGIVPAMQPAFFWEFGDGYIRNYGRHRADVMFPAKSLHRSGRHRRRLQRLARHRLPPPLRHRTGPDPRHQRRRRLRPQRARRPHHRHPHAHLQRRLRQLRRRHQGQPRTRQTRRHHRLLRRPPQSPHERTPRPPDQHDHGQRPRRLRRLRSRGPPWPLAPG